MYKGSNHVIETLLCKGIKDNKKYMSRSRGEDQTRGKLQKTPNSIN